MSRYGEIRLPLGAEERSFRLGIGEERAVEEKCDAGLPELAARLAPLIQLARASNAAGPAERGAILMNAIMTGGFGRFRVDDYREVIFQGLIGAGESRTMAGAIVMAEVDGHAPLPLAVTAFQIIMARLLGPEDEPLGETSGATARPRAPRSRASRRAGPKSTA